MPRRWPLGVVVGTLAALTSCTSMSRPSAASSAEPATAPVHATSTVSANAPVAPPTGTIQVPVAASSRLQHAIDSVYPALVQVMVVSVQEREGRDRKVQASGSGVIFSADGLLVTNYHVAGRTTSIRCILADREELPATVVGADALSDIAVLRLDLSRRQATTPLPIARFGSSGSLRVGDTVLAMGCPLAISHSVTEGIVANLDMTLPEPLEIEGENVGAIVTWIGTDAPIYPGNSGGPLVNLEGEVIGINEITFGLGGSIPIDLARGVIQQLVAQGHVTRIFLGAEFQPLLKQAVEAGAQEGVLVSGVLPGTPATGRLLPGDLVLAVNGSRVRARFQDELPVFMNHLLSLPIGQPITLTVLRSGARQDVRIDPGLRDETRARESETPAWGMTVRRITLMEATRLHRDTTDGVEVSSIRPGGPADSAVPSLRADDIIVQVGTTPTRTVADLTRATATLLQGQHGQVAATTRFVRDGEELLTVVDIGTRAEGEPPMHAAHGWIGVETQVLSPRLAEALGLKGHMGVRVTRLLPAGPAGAAGLQVGDIITAIDDAHVEASTAQDSGVFDAMVRSYRPGSKADLTVYRGTSPRHVSVTLGNAPQSAEEYPSMSDDLLEFGARDICYDDRIANRWDDAVTGAVVKDVESGGWAEVGGLRPNDLIQRVDGQTVTSSAELATALARATGAHRRAIVLFVRRGAATTYIELLPTYPSTP